MTKSFEQDDMVACKRLTPGDKADNCTSLVKVTLLLIRYTIKRFFLLLLKHQEYNGIDQLA